MYREFWQLAIKEYGAFNRLAVIWAVTLAGTILEAFNIGLLIPLLETLASPGEEANHWLSKSFAGIFEALGVPFRLSTILGALGFLIFGILSLKYLRLILVQKAQTSFSAWMRSRSMWISLTADTAYFDKERVGVLTDIESGQTARASTSVIHFTEIAASLGILFVYLFTSFLIAPVLAAVAFGAGLIITLLTQSYISRAKKIATTLVKNDNEFLATLIENLSGINVIKSFLLESIRWEDFNTKTQAVRNTVYLLGRNHSQLSVTQEIALYFVIGGIVYIGVSVLGIQIAVIMALLFIMYRAMPKISDINTRRQSLVASLAALHSVKQSMDDGAAQKVVSGTAPFKGLTKNIEFKHINFSYNASGQVLHDTSFVIEKGKMTAIVGSSGAGKSTIIDLILRFYDPVNGSVLADGVDLKEFDLNSWRGAIGVVSQDIFLFNDTVAYNIGFGRPELSIDDIKGAARRAYAHDFIGQLPQGYDTRIGDRGWNLSGGQRQRLALARAILTDPDILILDEATSSLDSESEQLIQQYMNEIRGSCTMIVVAHRLSTIKNADKIVVLQDGKIVEEGDWDSLLAKEGVLTNYHNLQSGGIGDFGVSVVGHQLDQENPQVTSGALLRADDDQ